MTFGINDNGYRSVVQWPSGKTFVKFEPGIYFDWFGTTTIYPDVMTYNFTGESVEGIENFTVNGINVRYQDGGTGSIYGVARFTLPIEEKAMLELHRAFRTEAGVRNRLIQPVINESINLTAGLLTSEEAYAEKRNEFIEWSQDQVAEGKYLTNIISRTQIVEPQELGKDGEVIKPAVTRIQNVPVIRKDTKTGIPMRGDSPLREYSVSVSGFQVTNWDFETDTLNQIKEKRAANMAIITSQANAAKANQQRLQAIAEGEKNVATAQYEQEVKKAEAVVVAEREKEVAEINASRQVEVNRQNYLAQVQDVKAAEQEAIARLERAKAEAKAKKLILEADGALSLKIEAWKEVTIAGYKEFGKQKWVPDIQMGNSSEGSGGTTAADMISLLSVNSAKDLKLDMEMRAKTN